jgi:hypothetical protein
MIGDLNNQIVYDAKTKKAIYYSFIARDKPVKLKDICDRIEEVKINLSVDQLEDFANIFAMINEGSITDEPDLSHFLIGFLLGKFTSNTNMSFTSYTGKILDEDYYDE